MTNRPRPVQKRPLRGPSDPARKALAIRLRTARETAEMTRPELARRLGWSVSRLVHYENGSTQPSVGELVELAKIFSINPASLAFGDGPGDLAGAHHDVAWLPCLGGDPLPMPAALLKGIPGPLVCTVLAVAGLGVSRGDILVLQPGGLPAPGQVWAFQGPADQIVIGWVLGATARSIRLQTCVAGAAITVPIAALQGRVCATLQRAPA